MRTKIFVFVWGLHILLTSCGVDTSGSSSAVDSSSSPSDAAISSSSSTPEQSTLIIEEHDLGYCRTVSVPIESEHNGYVGLGYANPENASGAGLEWQVDAANAGDAELTIRFANGGNTDRPGTLLINTGADGNVSIPLPPTSAWTQYTTTSVEMFLQQGINRVELLADSENGLPNIDSIALKGPELSPVDCAETPPPVPSGATLAFPGAMGFGRYAVGGRYGEVVHVTNLNDSGSGSLREAISQPNRIIVFDVGGVIKINERLVFKANQTIAGQTAPGDGITIYGNGTSFTNAHNTIVRYIRFRMGKIGDSGKDTVAIARGHDIIFDHVSISWGRDGNYDLNPDSGYEIKNITLQNSIVAQGLQTHSTGGLMDVKGGSSIIRSLYIDNHTRNPKARGVLQFVNNVVYHWAVAGYILGDAGNPEQAIANGVRYDGAVLGNMFISGPESNDAVMTRANQVYHLYAADNLYDSDKDGSLNPNELPQSAYGNVIWHNSPSSDYPDVPLLSPHDALNHVITFAGASKSRDAVDQFLINELQSWGLTGKTISDETSLGLPNVVGNIAGGKAPIDSDKDGMPDTWESNRGLNPNNPADAFQDDDGNGWINLEEYINGLAP